MPNQTHPYISDPNNISKMIVHLRRNFPNKVTSETVKQYGVASNHESEVINALQFIGVIDSDGNQITEKRSIFLGHDDSEFEQGFSEIIKNAYYKLVDLHWDNAWTLDDNQLIGFFSVTDNTSSANGKTQAGVF